MHEIKVYSAAGNMQSNGVSRANIRRDAPARRGARPNLVHVEETTDRGQCRVTSHWGSTNWGRMNRVDAKRVTEIETPTM